MMVWKMIFLDNWVIWRFHVNLQGCPAEKLPQSRERLMNGRCRRKPRVVVLGWSFMTMRWVSSGRDEWGSRWGGTGRALEVQRVSPFLDGKVGGL